MCHMCLVHHALSAYDDSSQASLRSSPLVSQVLRRTHVARTRCGKFSFFHFEVHTEILLVYPDAAKGTLNSHTSPAQAVVKVLLSAVQLPHVWHHKPGQEGVGWFTTDEGKENDVATTANTGNPRNVVHILPYLHWQRCGYCGL